MNISKHSLFRNYFLLAAVEGLFVLVGILTAATDPSNIWLLGYSRTRLVIAGVVLATAGGFAAIGWRAHQSPARGSNMGDKVADWVAGKSKYFTALMVLGVAALFGLYLFFVAAQVSDNLVRLRLERLRPLLLWLLFLSAQAILFLPTFRYYATMRKIKLPTRILRASVVILLVFLGIASLMSWTRIGLEPDRIGWDNPGAPVLALQLFAVVIAGVSILGISLWINRVIKKYPKVNRLGGRFIHVDMILGALIWLTAILMWSAEPLTPTYFSPQVQAPNFEFYPYSDASLHDRAGQNLIIGEGYQPVVEKPLYSLFLGLTHLLVGQDYRDVINIQVALLALFPVVVFLLSTRFHHRLTGLFAAGLLIFRETNTIALSPQIRVSHSKLLMTDLPAAFLISIFIMALFWWLSNSDSRREGAILAGGTLGVTLLVRSQAILLIPVVLVGLILITRLTLRRFFLSAALFVVGVGVVIVPWMWRNFQITGQFGYSQPRQALYIAKQYSLTPEDDDPGFPEGTTPEEYTSLGFSKMISFTRSYPGVVLKFVTSHFLRNEISALFIFPLSYSDIATNNQGGNLFGVDPFIWQDCCSLNALVASTPYWGEWSGDLSGEAVIAMLINLGLISLGIGIAYQRWRFLGLLPLFLHLGYSLSAAVGRISGWRLILPVDWIVILYFCIGLAQLVLWGIAFFKNEELNEIELQVSISSEGLERNRKGSSYGRSMAIGAVFLLIGISVPLAEGMFPLKYAPVSNAETKEILEEYGNRPYFEMGVEQFLKEDNAVATTGRLLYPRYYRAQELEPGEDLSDNPLLVDRLIFTLAGPVRGKVLMPLNDPPTYIANASDVLVIGCQRDGYLLALVLVIINLDGDIIYSDVEPAPTSCSQINIE